MPKFDGPYGIDGLLYTESHELSDDRYLMVRHATWWDALRWFGLETMRLDRLDRPLMAKDWLGCWEPLGDRQSLTGRLVFSGGMKRATPSPYERWTGQVTS